MLLQMVLWNVGHAQNSVNFLTNMLFCLFYKSTMVNGFLFFPKPVQDNYLQLKDSLKLNLQFKKSINIYLCIYIVVI